MADDAGPEPGAAGSGQAGAGDRAGAGSGRAPGAFERVAGHRALAGEEQAAHTWALARALQDVWLGGTAFSPGGGIDWLEFAHAVEERLIADDAGTDSPAAPFAEVTVPVDTDRIEHLARRWLQRTQNDDPRLADKLMNEVAAVVRGVRLP